MLILKFDGMSPRVIMKLGTNTRQAVMKNKSKIRFDLPVTLSVVLWKVYGWLVYRPIRRFFSEMLAASLGPRWWFKRVEWDESYLLWPNVHWWFLYKTVFRFFKWMYWDAWRKLCKWDRVLKHKPWYASFIHWIGSYTAGAVISGGRCTHCGRKAGDKVELSDTKEYFRLVDSWSVGTMDGTDHRFFGYTCCPCCHHVASYEDGSL
jgi:hypothetical protein